MNPDVNQVFHFMEWETVHNLVWSLSKQIVESNIRFSVILPIHRGGMTVAHMLSHYCGINIALNYNDLVGNILLVDDIVNTGNTITKYKKIIYESSNTTIATLCLLRQNRKLTFPIEFIGEDVSCDEFIVFPWECYGKSGKHGSVNNVVGLNA